MILPLRREQLQIASFRWLIVVIVTPALLLAGLAWKAVPAHAAGYDCGAYPAHTWHDGFIHNVNDTRYSFEGVSSFIITRFGALCGTDHDQISNFTNAYAMIAGSQVNTGCQWAQAGFERGYVAAGGINIRNFAQTAAGCTNVRTGYGGYIAANVRHTYQALYHTACNCTQTYIDGGLWVSTNFSPYNAWDFPFDPQFTGETRYQVTDMPGLYTSQTALTALGAQNVDNDALVAMPCTMLGINDNPDRWGRGAAACDSISIYTK